jgi:hypothetical protein
MLSFMGRTSRTVAGKPLSRRLFLHLPEIVLCVLMAILAFHLIASLRRLAGKRHVALVVSSRVGAAAAGTPSSARPVEAARPRACTPLVAPRARASPCIILHLPLSSRRKGTLVDPGNGPVRFARQLLWPT